MECQFAFICDFAEQDGKLHAVGIGWDSIFTAQLPAAPPGMCIVARLRGSVAEAGTKDVALRLIDADGSDVIPPLEQQLPFSVRPGLVEGGMNLIFNLTGLPLPKYGAYSIHVLVNGNELQRLSFSVVRPPTTE